MGSSDLSRTSEALAPRFRVLREIGRGAGSRVYLAEDRKLERRVAIKVLDEELARSLAAERFMREIQIAAGLSHPHVLPLYDSGEADGLLFYVMPLVEGESLRQKLAREGQLPLDAALRIAGEVLDALGYAHAHGIVHRDITPGNILLSDGHAWVADFGVARALEMAASDSVTETGQFIGTPSYMSPEQATADGAPDARSDLYSLGCVMYEMLVGQPPYTGPSAQVVLARHTADAIPQLRAARPQTPEEVERVVRRALAKSPSDRFRGAEEMAEALGLQALPPGVGRTPASSSGARRPLGAILAIAVVLAVIAIGYRFLGDDRDSGTFAASAADSTSLAVLPFEDLTPLSEYGWLAIGLTHELIEALTTALDVRSYGASRPYAEGELPPDTIGRRLNVATLVSGRLELVGDALRVTVNLTDAGSGRRLGGAIETEVPLGAAEAPLGEAELAEVSDSLRFRMVEEVARALRENLGHHITLERWRREAGNAEAWNLLTRSVAQTERAERERLSGEIIGALELLLEADSLATLAAAADPDWVEPTLQRGRLALSLSVVANAARLRARSDGGAPEARIQYGTPEGWLEDGLQILSSVRSERPRAAAALGLRGRLLYRLRRHVPSDSAATLLDAAEVALRQAVRIDPDQTGAWLGLSEVLGSKGDFRGEADAASRAIETDAFLTLDEEGVYAHLWSALRDERFSEAQALCSNGRARFPSHDLFLDCRLAVIGFSGSDEEDAAEAAAELARIEAAGPAEPVIRAGRRMWLAFVLARAGFADSAHRVVDGAGELVEDEEDRIVLLFSEARVAALLGDEETALEVLGRFLDARPERRAFVANHPFFRTLRDDPRFRKLVQEEAPASS